MIDATGRNLKSAHSVTLVDHEGCTYAPGSTITFHWNDGASRVEFFDTKKAAEAELARLGFTAEGCTYDPSATITFRRNQGTSRVEFFDTKKR